MDGRLLLVLVCFFLSGASALVYQTAWTREFAFVFGTSELAVATVLAAYMGGLALGAAAGGRLSARVRRPVLLYGVLELAIGLAALAVPYAMRAATALYVLAFGGRAETPEVGGLTTALFYAACAFVILALPTACMGATLPLLARHAVRSDRELGGRVGLLYAVNTLGAVAGTLVAGFVLVPRLGLAATVGCAVAVNLAVFGLALPLARGPGPAPAGEARADAPRARTLHPILPMMLVSGAVSFTYEVLWTRLLGQLLGASVYAFATMLASFLIGIALGAVVASRFASDPRRAAAGFGVAQAGAALLSLTAFAILEGLAGIAGGLRAAGGGRGALDAAIAGATLLPATLAIGATFPFAVRIAARGGADAGPASARVYAWNTLGAILGALGSGFFAIPAFGFAATLAGAALTNAALGLASTWLVVPRLRWLPWLALPLAAGLAALWPRTPWAVLRTTPIDLARLAGDVEYYGVGRSTTVLLLSRGGTWHLTNNGLPEAAIAPRGGLASLDPTLNWLALLPTLARPEAEDLFVVGFGGGSLLELVPASVRRVDVVELEPEVIAANAAIGSRRLRDPLADPRVHVLLNDARNALALSGKRYDAILSQPSHPWTAGASHLYTREFFALARSRLADDGVLVQWIGPAYVDEELLRILVATLLDVLPHVRVYQGQRHVGILLIGSPAPLASAYPAAALPASAEPARVAAGLLRPEDELAALALDEAGARAFAAGAPLNTDRRNHLQIRSPRLGDARGRRTLLDLEEILLRRGLAPAAPPGSDLPALVRALGARGFGERSEAVAAAIAEPAERHAALGLIAERKGERSRALGEYRRALAARPGSAEARAGLVRLLAAGSGEAADATALDPGEAAVLWGLEDAAAGRLAELEPREPLLAALPRAHPLAVEATRLRARWRIATGDPARARQAVALLDGLSSIERRRADLYDRARAGAVAGDPEVLLASLEALLALRPPLARAHAEDALGLLRTAATPRDLSRRRAEAEQRLEALSRGERPSTSPPAD